MLNNLERKCAVLTSWIRYNHKIFWLVFFFVTVFYALFCCFFTESKIVKLFYDKFLTATSQVLLKFENDLKAQDIQRFRKIYG